MRLLRFARNDNRADGFEDFGDPRTSKAGWVKRAEEALAAI